MFWDYEIKQGTSVKNPLQLSEWATKTHENRITPKGGCLSNLIGNIKNLKGGYGFRLCTIVINYTRIDFVTS